MFIEMPFSDVASLAAFAWFRDETGRGANHKYTDLDQSGHESAFDPLGMPDEESQPGGT